MLTLWKHEIQVPAGFETAVNFEVTTRRPLYVGKYDQVHFVSLAPSMITASTEAKCLEGIPVKMTADIRLQMLDEHRSEVLKNSGYATYKQVVRVQVQDVAERQNLAQVIKACMQTFIRGSEFFNLRNQEDTRKKLNDAVQAECKRAKLAGEVVSSDLVLVVPDPELLSQLRARAGMTEVVEGGNRTRGYSDRALGDIVDYFLETLRQKDLIQEETERAKDERERAGVERQQQMTCTRAELKIVEMEQENRIAVSQAELQAQEMARNLDAQKRNADIKKTSAEYEFAYNKKRLEENMELAQQEVELAKVKEAEDAAVRERRRADMGVELERERELAKIRADERTNALTDIGKVIEKMKDIPPVNYQGVSTLVTTGTDSRDHVSSLLLTAMTRFLDRAAIPGLTDGGADGVTRERGTTNRF